MSEPKIIGYTTKTIYHPIYEYNGVKIKDNGDLLDLLADLAETDGFVGKVMLYDKEMEKQLIEARIARPCSPQGYVAATDWFKENSDKIIDSFYEIYYEWCDKDD